MKEIELYDIITLDNDEEYTVLQSLNEFGKKYFLLAVVDEEEEPDLENIKIVEEIKENGKIIVEEVEDTMLLQKLSKKFLELLKENL